MFLFYFFEVVKIKRTLGIFAFMNNKMLTILYRFAYAWAMRTAEFMSFREAVVIRWRMQVKADFASNLGLLFTIIPCKIWLRSIADMTWTVIRNVAFNPSESGFYGFAIALFIVSDKVITFPVLFIRYDAWKFINLEFLICRRLGIIISPLFEWDIFTDKKN